MAKTKASAEEPTPIVVPISLSGGKIPMYATAGAAGADLYAYVEDDQTILPGWRAKIPLGIRCAIPYGYVGFVVPRSGLSEREGLVILNAPGTIDSDFRGEWNALVINHGSLPVTVRNGDRIAQVVFVPVAQVQFELTETLPETTRGEGGFGSTGTR